MDKYDEKKEKYFDGNKEEKDKIDKITQANQSIISKDFRTLQSYLVFHLSKQYSYPEAVSCLSATRTIPMNTDVQTQYLHDK